MLSSNTKLSKLLSYVLRHGASSLQIYMAHDGLVQVSELLAHEKFRGFRERDVIAVVDNCPKQRFELVTRDGVLFIRARQGHSIESIDFDEMLERVSDPSSIPVCIHGTYMKYKQLIKRDGLKRMKRTHIHMIPDYPTKNEVISGMRTTCNLYIVINVEEAMKAGVAFYRSSNNVILSPGVGPDGCIPPEFLSFHQPGEMGGN